MVLLVSYDLKGYRNPADYHRIGEEIKAISGIWCHLGDSRWLVETDQTTPSSTNPTIIGTALKHYAVSVFFEDTREQHWSPEHLVELIDHNPGATMRIGDMEYVRNPDGSWAERPSGN